tara:strand:- start:29 stop:766 length:738 start_codon:yes stop_codon:yes gene_type:complete
LVNNAGVRVSPPQQRDREEADDGVTPPKRTTAPDDEVVVYTLVFLPTGARVYTGRTKDPERRLSQHAARNSKCRLVRNAFRKYGRKNFSLEVILRCRASDADANESYYIIRNNTLYPNGYNLRHGSTAGEESDLAMVPACTRAIAFKGFADEASACAEAWQDVADIAGDLEAASNKVDDVCSIASAMQEVAKQSAPVARAMKTVSHVIATSFPEHKATGEFFQGVIPDVSVGHDSTWRRSGTKHA